MTKGVSASPLPPSDEPTRVVMTRPRARGTRRRRASHPIDSGAGVCSLEDEMAASTEPRRSTAPRAGIERTVHLVTPLGLGAARALGDSPPGTFAGVPASRDVEVLLDRLRRAVDKADHDSGDGTGRVVFTDLHWADDAALDVVEDMVARAERLVVLASAGSLPERLLGYVSSTMAASPLYEKAFAAELPGLDEAELSETHRFCGGWPEALNLGEGRRLDPSADLRRFLRGLQIAHPHLATAALTITCAVDGLTVEQLAACLETDIDTGFDRLASLERLGVLTWSGSRATAAFPAVRAALTEHETERRRGTVLLARGIASLDRADALLVGIEAGFDNGETARDLMDVLRQAEESLDFQLWGRAATALSRCQQDDLRREGLVALARLGMCRGDTEGVETSIASIPGTTSGSGTAELQRAQVGLERDLTSLNGLDVRFLAARVAPAIGDMFPTVSHPELDEGDSGMRHLVAAIRGFDLPPELDRASPDGPARILRFVAAVISSDFDRAAREVELGGGELAPLGDLPRVALCAWEGRFEEAAQTLTAQVGADWAVVSPLHRAVGLLVATGWSVKSTRRLVPHVDIPEPGRLGSLALMAVRMRAEIALGRIREAATGAEDLGLALRRHGSHGLLAAFAPDILDATALEGDLSVLADAEPVGSAAPFVRLAQALRAGRHADAEAEIDSEPGVYRSARLQRLLARRLLESGGEEHAVALLRQSAAVFESIGAPVDLAVARALIRRVDPRYEWRGFTTADSGDDGVTRRESDVLDLVLAGLSNAEIGAQLHISVATVKRHVGSLFRRYDVTSRRQLVHVAGDRGRPAS